MGAAHHAGQREWLTDWGAPASLPARAFGASDLGSENRYFPTRGIHRHQKPVIAKLRDRERGSILRGGKRIGVVDGDDNIQRRRVFDASGAILVVVELEFAVALDRGLATIRP